MSQTEPFVNEERLARGKVGQTCVRFWKRLQKTRDEARTVLRHVISGLLGGKLILV
jgi:hypothetical protein